ncbi:hypothetical protein [Maricaulis sp.]|uniref:hypothetical protein n=1 Tax=Maricaulis sp. TaxID=1486257 RepID=UPI00262E5D9C|nr:hypothetical protein [Maricaulis sp.]
MAGAVVVLVFHGIGTYRDKFGTKKSFDRPLWDGLYRRMGEVLEKDVIWAPVLWSLEDLEAYQKDLIKERKDWKRLFGFVASALADASAYQMLALDHENRKGSNYYRVQRTVYGALRGAAARAEALGHELDKTPILAVCQSMGCHILSSYAWDVRQHPERIFDEGEEVEYASFATLENLASAVFTGCNLPLLTAGIPVERKVPLRITRNSAKWGRAQRWLNFYDPDDVLGYPLEEEFAAYWGGRHPDQEQLLAERGRDPDAEVWVKDTEYEMRTVLGLPTPTGMSPFVHNEYWRSGEVLSAVEHAIRALLER